MTHLRNQSKARFQRSRPLGRHAAKIEVLLILRRTVGKDDRQIGRRDAHVAQGELVLLRMVPAGRHVVHRPPRRQEDLQTRLHPPARHEKMVRREAGVGVGKGVPRIEHQQLVQQGGAGTPMADDEDRVGLDLRAVDLPPQQGDLDEPENEVDEAQAADQHGHGDAPGSDGEAVAHAAARPAGHAHPVPKAGNPRPVLVARFLLRRRFAILGWTSHPLLGGYLSGVWMASPSSGTLSNLTIYSIHPMLGWYPNKFGLRAARRSALGKFAPVCHSTPCIPSGLCPAERRGTRQKPTWTLGPLFGRFPLLITGATDVSCSHAAPRGTRPLGPYPRPDSAYRHGRQHSGDPGAGAGRLDGPVVGRQYHHRGDYAADNSLRANAAGVQRLSVLVVGHNPIPAGVERGHDAVDSYPRRQRSASWRPAESY